MPSNSICDTCRHGSYVSIGCPAKYRDVFFDDYTREVVDCKYYSKQVSMLERLLNEAKRN